MRKHRKILISRVLILIVAILSVLCILGAVILFFTMMFNGSDSTDPTTPSPSAEVMESTSIEGTIVDATMNTLSIVTDDGRVLAFNSENMDSTTSGNGLFIDTRVRIDYQENLKDSSVRQFVMVQDITVLSGSTIVTPVESETPQTIAPTDNPQETTTPQSTADATPQPTPSVDPIEARAQQILDTMSIEEKIGQMFIARCLELTLL